MTFRRLMVATMAVALLATACADDSDPAADDTATEDSSADDGEMTEDEMTEGEMTESEGAAAGVELPDPLVFTLTPSQEAGGLIETAQPLADLLSEKLGVAVEASVPTDYAGVIAALESDQAQVAGGLGPRQMVQAQEQAGATLILQSERFGSFSYVTQWFTNDPDTYCEDEPVGVEQEEGEPYLFCNGVGEAEEASEGPIGQDMLSNVEGQVVSFVEQGSTSGYAVPALQLSEQGIDPFEDIDGLFAGGHDQSVQAVYDGDAVVGTSFNDARDNLVEQTPDVGQQVVVFGWSGAIPNDGFAASGSLSEEAVQVITDALLEICEDDGACGEGGVLTELYSIDGLAPVDDEGIYDGIRQLEQELGDQLG